MHTAATFSISGLQQHHHSHPYLFLVDEQGGLMIISLGQQQRLSIEGERSPYLCTTAILTWKTDFISRES